MDKKNTYTIIGVMFAVLFLGATLFGDKFPVGETILHDSTSAILTINKNVYIGGSARVSAIDFKELGGRITEDISGIISSSNLFTFETLYENSLMTLDSSNGLVVYRDAIFQNIKLGSSAKAYYEKEVKFLAPSSPGGIATTLHGVSAYRKISSFQAMIRDAATGIEVMPQSWGGTYLFMARIDSTYLKVYLVAGTSDLTNDTVTFTLRIDK